MENRTFFAGLLFVCRGGRDWGQGCVCGATGGIDEFQNVPPWASLLAFVCLTINNFK